MKYRLTIELESVDDTHIRIQAKELCDKAGVDPGKTKLQRIEPGVCAVRVNNWPQGVWKKCP